MKENWILRRRNGRELALKLRIDPLLASLIRARIPDEEAEDFLDREGPLHDPFLMKDLSGAVDSLIRHIGAGDTIMIVGDYDVDGVTSSSILYLGLTGLGAKAKIRIPGRVEDGYGIRTYMVDEAIEEGCGLILTCDNGIREFETMDYAASKGMEVILTDHHEITVDKDGNDVLPVAKYILNPHRQDCPYPAKNLCGAGVAYKLMQGLYQKMGKPLPATLLGYAALGTVCDLMTLVGENRRIVWQGLKIWNEAPPVGIRAMMDAAAIHELTVYHCGFVIGPMINAGGRLDHQQKFIQVLLTEDPTEAMELAFSLKSLNEERQHMTTMGVEQAVEEADRAFTEDKVKVIHLPKVHESIAGLIAGKLKEYYHRPVFVLTGETDVIKGSGRSIEGYNMFGELLKQDALLEKYGGHPMAAGLSIQKANLEAFRSQINEACELTEEDCVPKVYADCLLPLSHTSLSLAELMEKLEPYGNGNERPVFAATGLKLTGLRVMGRNRNAARLYLSEQGHRCEAICFRMEALEQTIREKYGETVWNRLCEAETFRQGLDLDILYHLGINEYRGVRNVQCTVCNMR